MVLQEYFHFFYIPVCPVGPKNVKAWCHDCGQRFGSASFEKEYEDKAKTPIYFYSIPLIFSVLILIGVFANLSTQKEKVEFVQNPKKGDIYLIRKDKKDTTSYYFLKVKDIKGDTITLYHNDRIYSSYPTSLAPIDSFITMDPLYCTRLTLKKMLDADEINSVER